MRKTKVGVVGFGYWGKNQARVFHELGVLEGIFDSNLSMKNNKTYKFYDNLDELIDVVDGIVICTPADTHYEIAKKALKNVDILVEKPLALKSSQVKSLINIEKKNNKLIMVGHQLHFHPAVLKMKDLINSGEIGKI